ncbi:heterogeneous nuclear ribonucleoprotein q isoform x4 [Limosa lapponica baueri]|uniref:Heterogeneous nuclear ribonucleoprotein q isoform x4 n=1 Tax=Limosa lapponica baueri TaxID=1758121 RepID=A0A2I0TKR2_LIMLA|nr:heterogeneous nuclear ribonucleoprotein q isoform x4 [Limosa lapponica baueri]
MWQISRNMATEHVNGNGTEEPMDTSAAVTHSEHFQTLLDAGLPQKVAEKLDEIYVAGLVAHSDLDERAIEALKEFNEEGALAVLQQFKDSDLSHVQNKSAFLCGVMKTYRQREKQGTKVADSSKGPDEAKIKALLERTGYTLDVTTGQRKYGGPPPESVYSGQQPSVGTEIFVGKIPRDLFEDELVPLFEKAGPIWDLRLMMDPLTGLNRGYAFVTFCTKEAAQEAVKLPDDKKKNRGFCFLEYEDHKTAAQARRRLMSGKVKVWGNVVTVEWADPIEDPDPEVMAKRLKIRCMMITTIMVHLICPLQQEVEAEEAEVVTDIPLTITATKIIMIIMAMTTITIVVDMKILTMVMKIFKLELEEGVVEEQGVLLHPEVAGLLLPVAEPVMHREVVLDQQEAFVVREEVPSNKEAAGREKGSRPVLTCYNED